MLFKKILFDNQLTFQGSLEDLMVTLVWIGISIESHMLAALLEGFFGETQSHEVSLLHDYARGVDARRWYIYCLSCWLALLRWDLTLFRWDLLALGGLGPPLISHELSPSNIISLPLQRFLGDLVLVDGLGLGCRGLLGRLGFLRLHNLKSFGDLNRSQNFLDTIRGLSHSRRLLVINQ